MDETGSGVHQNYTSIDTEWEYEYDENETEDLYFTLDLTAHDVGALDSRKATLDPASIFPGVNGPRDDTSETHGYDQRSSDRAAPVEEGSQLPFQILDLHTTNPIVKVGTDVYSCYWSTDLGTQVHVAPAGLVEKSVRPGHVVDIVATSRVRLSGRPVTLVQKPSYPKNDQNLDRGTSSNDAIPIEDDGPDARNVLDPSNVNKTAIRHEKADDSDLQPLVIPQEVRRTREQDRHADFLERLSAIKIRKGEKDTVPIYVTRNYKLPGNWEQIRSAAMERTNGAVATAASGADVVGDANIPEQTDGIISKRMTEQSGPPITAVHESNGTPSLQNLASSSKRKRIEGDDAG